jgi:hypothetical protein
VIDESDLQDEKQCEPRICTRRNHNWLKWWFWKCFWFDQTQTSLTFN